MVLSHAASACVLSQGSCALTAVHVRSLLCAQVRFFTLVLDTPAGAAGAPAGAPKTPWILSGDLRGMCYIQSTGAGVQNAKHCEAAQEEDPQGKASCTKYEVLATFQSSNGGWASNKNVFIMCAYAVSSCSVHKLHTVQNFAPHVSETVLLLVA